MNMKYLFLLAALAVSVPFASAKEMAQESAPAAVANDGNFSGQVAETMTTAGYTYVLVKTGSNKQWAATTKFSVQVGDTVTVTGGMSMPNYHSKTLNRDFDLVYFTGSITVQGGVAETTPALPPGHPSLTGAPAPVLPPGHVALTNTAARPQIDLTGVKKADGGKTIAEIFAAPSTLAGQSVTVRGKVVKSNPQVMGKNWLHIQDGSGSAANNNNDLTVTTATAAQVGDTVLVTGNASTNKDFGAGYKYNLILDDAKVTVE